ncbi:hypothetical protein ACGLHS_12610 [Variovorax sp. VaC1]|nr:hypothetical protein SAMN03159363_5931 [Variovorax sp. EL159]
MFDHHDSHEQPYTVHLDGTSLSLRDLMEVRFTFIRVLEQRIGGPAQVLKCYRAWASQMESGARTMAEAQIASARAWQEAWEHASEVTVPLLSHPQTTVFRFELC